jgi:hypothetical protein
MENDTTTSLGLRYLLGAGVPTDPARGMALIEEAALAGDARGAYLAATIASCYFWRNRDWDEAFDFLMRAARKGHDAAQSSMRILAGSPSGNVIEGNDWAAMRGKIDLAAWLAPPEAQLVRETPRIQVIEKFVTPAVCDWLIAQTRQGLSRATIYDKKTGGTTEDGRRTNSQCDLDIETCGVLTFVIRARIAAITHRHDKAMEVPKVLHYSPGETFATRVQKATRCCFRTSMPRANPMKTRCMSACRRRRARNGYSRSGYARFREIDDSGDAGSKVLPEFLEVVFPGKILARFGNTKKLT